MNESWIGKSDSEIRNDIVAIAKEETGLTSFKSTGVLRGFIEVIARVVLFIYRSAINPIYDNASLDNAGGFFLSLWGLNLGVVRKQAEKTSGALTASSHGDGSIEAGTWARVEGTELRFKVSQTVNFKAETQFAIPVTAEHSGVEYNIGSGAAIRLTRVVNGFDAVSVSENWITEPGRDVEDDPAYRARIKSKWNGQVLGNTKDVYKFYAEAVGGVRAAKIIRAPRGAGSTDVVIASTSGLPSSELLAAVKENLYAHELMAFDVQVKAPRVVNVAIQIEFSGEASESEIAILAERYIQNLEIGNRLKLSDLYELYRPLNLHTIEIITPERDIQPEEDEVITAAVKAVKAGS